MTPQTTTARQAAAARLIDETGLACRYGHFAAEGSEYRITDPRTPRPWVNVIANPLSGLVVSQTGSGFSWVGNSQLAAITRWEQDLVKDCSGKFLFVRDADSGEAWSLSPAPMWRTFDDFRCDHGLGYTTFHTRYAGIAAEWTLFAHKDLTAEMWLVRLTNLTDAPRRLEVTAFLEWCCGVSPSPRREFQKLFIETWFDADQRAVLARSHMWDVPSQEHGHWNTDFPYVCALASTLPVDAVEGDKAAFLGQYGDVRRPAALASRYWHGYFGRHHDPIAAMRGVVTLDPQGMQECGYILASNEDQSTLQRLMQDLSSTQAIRAALRDVTGAWRKRLDTQRVETPDAALNHLTNDWLRYQAISGRMWGRCGYYQQSGAFGFRDQLQDSLVWLGIDVAKCREQIQLHAAHQFADGSVYHWWHPLSEQGLRTQMTDDLLWLAFATAEYIKETGDTEILSDTAPFVDDPQPASILNHVRRAFDRVFSRFSERGLPLIGAGDWNDGLSAAGLQNRGESVWLGHFLAGLLAEWAEVLRRIGSEQEALDLSRRRDALVAAINTHGWDGEWYMRGTLDDGRKLGSAECQHGSVFLNAQTWAVLNDVAPADRAEACMAAVRERLMSQAGPLLLAPAYTKPDPAIGYITRYAPGLRENGGVYTHAACWALAAACKVSDTDLTRDILSTINPARRDPDRYWSEPYVTPGNIDGPDSPYYGRGGWSWYTGSASWLQRVITHWVLGVRPTWAGLLIAPCLPTGWRQARITRVYRGVRYDIEIQRTDSVGPQPMVTIDGMELTDNVIRPGVSKNGTHKVVVKCR